MQYHPSHKHHPLSKEYISHEEIPAEDLVPSLTLQSINNNMQNMNNKPQSYDSRRKTYRNEEMEETPEKEGSEFSMSYSPSNPTRTNTLSHRANSRNFPGKKGTQASHGSIDFPKARDFQMEAQIHMPSDENESHMHDLESKRDCVYEALEYARGQIRNFDEEMKMIGKKHSSLVGEFEKNYKTIENETEQYYNEILEKWKEVVREKILRYRSNYEGMIQEQEHEVDQLKEVIAKVEEQNAELTKRNEELENERDGILQKFEDEYERVERQKSDTIKSLDETYKEQIETLERENNELASDLKNVQMKLKSTEEKSSKETKNLERFNNSLKENNDTLKIEIRKLKDELANNSVSFTLDNLCSRVELQTDFDKQIKIVKKHEGTIKELNQVISKLNSDLQSVQETYETFKSESTDKYRELEEKAHKLKVMLRLERPKKGSSRSTTPTDTLRESRLQDSEQTSRIFEEEKDKSRLDVSTIITPQYPPLAPLLEQIEEALKKKEKLSTQIKAWINNFNRKEKRMPSAQEKEPIRELYQQHSAMVRQVKAAKDSILMRESGNTQDKDVSILKTESDERVGLKSKSMSPKRAQMMRMRNMNPNNVSTLSINASFDGSGTGNLNTSVTDQSILQPNSFYHSSGLPMAMSNDVLKLKNETSSLRDELHQLRLKMASRFDENDVINQLKSEIQTMQRDKKLLKDKAVSLSMKLKAVQGGASDTSMIGGGDDMGGRKSIDSERYRIRAENENKLKEAEERYSSEMESLKHEYKQQIADIIKAKDILISTTTQENQGLKEENNKLIREFKMNNQEFSKLKLQYKELDQEVHELKKIKAHLEARIRTEISQRKKLHNIVEDMKGKVRVFCRVRPMIKSEVDRGCRSVATLIDDFNLNLETKNGPKVFPYDSCFGPSASQEQIFEDTKRLIQSAVDGYNTCVFAYGQTGSGKTYTMYGSKERPGITPRAIEEIYHILGQMESFCDIKVSCHMVELHLDTLKDLLQGQENRKPLEIKEDSKGMIYIQNVTIKQAPTKEDLSKIIKQGMMNRTTSGTAMNDFSSRSHLIVNIVIEIHNLHTDQRTIGKLSLVDLAGSERASKAQTNTRQLNEAKAINKSLSALGDVISALSSQVLGDKDRFVPYRNNKLTMLMKDCLGGTAKTLMFVNVSPADDNFEETQTSLNYATRVKLIVNETVKNIETKEFSKMKEHLKNVTEERDAFRHILVQNGIPLARSQLGSLSNTPSKFDGDESKFEEGPVYQIPINESFKFST